jgi:hypothetical protein
MPRHVSASNVAPSEVEWVSLPQYTARLHEKQTELNGDTIDIAL